MPEKGRNKLQASTAEAFAPAAISNFFAIHDEALGESDYADFHHVGATGGGFTLSSGVYSRASIFNGSNERKIRISVNGSPNYKATTTRRAVELLVGSLDIPFSAIEIEQLAEVPIGYGFGTSAASALSAVMAVSSALDLSLTKERVAYFAHAAEIICQTGLGTVSSIWSHAGAGLISVPGAPGVAKVANVSVPSGLRIVTALLAPFRKSRVLSSRGLRQRVNRLGNAAVSSVEMDMSFDNLLRAGQVFSQKLGLATEDIERLIRLSLENGAIGAGQNMIGHAVHAIVPEENLGRTMDALRSDSSSPMVMDFRFGSMQADMIQTWSSPIPRLSALSGI